MKELVFLLEEPSAQDMLEGLLPKLLPEGIGSRCIPFVRKTGSGKAPCSEDPGLPEY